MADAELMRALKIKTGSCKRIRKELGYYEKDAAKEKTKLEKMREDGADGSDIKQQENVEAESAMMIPDCRQRLETALTDLQSAVAEVEEAAAGEEAAAALAENEEVKAAKEAVSDAQSVFEAP